eukprot:m.164981 g.164981  ORF g.164981 m.164981 type:complete len:221 (+) comp17730_c0_seq1:35-697(+)
MTPIIEETESFVRKELDGMEGSHDFHHIQRVRKMAKRLAAAEKLSEEECEIAELAALLHDIEDWKYSGSETAGAEKALEFLLQQNYPREKADRVVAVVQNVSFHSELGGTQQGTEMPKALGVVQDADRLDAIGAIGIARCFAFGGSKGRPIYDPECKPEADLGKEAYMKSATPSVNHFYEKLLRLKGMMKTPAGLEVAEQRHAFMEGYLKQFFAEQEAEA